MYSEAVGEKVILAWYNKTVEMLKWTVVSQPQFRKRIVVSWGITVIVKTQIQPKLN